MITNRKNVFTVELDPAKGETSELLMLAIAMAIFDLAPALHDDDSGVDDLHYSKSDTLTAEEAAKHVINGREVAMMFPKGRMCVAHVFASRLTANEAEIVLSMYDLDGDQLLARASDIMDRLVAEKATDVDVEFDLELEDILEADEPVAISA